MLIEYILVFFISSTGPVLTQLIDTHDGIVTIFDHEQDCDDHAKESEPEIIAESPLNTEVRYLCLPLMTESV